MSNLNKRVLTSVIVLPLSMYFIIMGGNFIVSFLYAILILGNFEVFSAFKRKLTIILIDFILVLSLLAVLFLRNDTASSFFLLLWVIILTILSDVGGYVFGKFFKGKKLTKISPNKTISGSIGSFIMSLISVPIFYFLLNNNFAKLFELVLISIVVSFFCQFDMGYARYIHPHSEID